MKHLRQLLPALILAAASLASCEKEIDFKYHDIPPEPVIEGLLTDEGVSVRLTQTVATDEPFSPALTAGAEVTVTDLTEGLDYRLTPDSASVFTSGALRGIPGHTYSLTVRKDDRSYTCESTMLGAVKIVSAEFNWIKMPYDDVAILKVMFTASADPMTCYWMRVYRNGEVYEWQGIDGRNVENGLVTGMMMTSRRDIDEEDEGEVLREGDVVDIEVMQVSRHMYDYLNSLNNGDYNGLRLFSGSSCLGYFLAAPVALTSVIYDPAAIPYAP